MNTYEVSLTLEIEAMHEESAENKLEAFLSGLDLKKNDKVFCTIVGPITKTGSDESDESPVKTEPKDEWEGIGEDEWEGIGEEDWDTLGTDETTPSPEEPEEEQEEPEEPEEDDHGFKVILKQINNPTTEEPSEDDSEIEEDWWIAD